MRKISILIMMTLLLSLLCACSDAGDTAQEPASQTNAVEASEPYHFIFVCPIVENEYWQSCIEGIRKADAELGTTTQIVGPQTADHFAEEIIGYMEEAVESKPDGILAYAGLDAMKPLIAQAADKDIPVLAIDSDAPDTERIAYLGTDLYNFGYKSGLSMIGLTNGTAKIGYICSTFSAESEAKVFSAFKDAIQDHDIEIAATAEGQAIPEKAEEVAEQMLSEHPEITAIFCTAGYNATGAARAKQKLHRDDLVLVGFDDTVENLEFVRQGVINALLVQSPNQMGYQGVCRMKEYLDTGSLSQTFYDTGTVLLTQDNVGTYSANGLVNAKKNRLVRVGYYNGDTSFQDGFNDRDRKSGYAYEYYQAIAPLVGWKYEYVYGTRTEILDKLQAGEVDIAAGIYQTESRRKQMLFSRRNMGMNDEERYFAVNLEQPELLEELDRAMEQLNLYSPDLLLSLNQKYYNHTPQQMLLTIQETTWLADKGDLRFGYVRHNLPLSDQGEDGNPTGFVKTLFQLFEKYLSTPLVPVCYETVSDMEAALSAGEIDAAFPMYSDLWLSEQKGLRQTNAFINDRVMIIYRDEYTSDLMDRVALSKTGIGQQGYLSAYYPDSTLVFYDTRKATLDAIARGDERCTVGASSILQRFLGENPIYQSLNIAYLDTSENFGISVNQKNSPLVGILNKALQQIDSAAITSAIAQYSGVEYTYTWKDFLQKHALEFILILIAFLGILLWAFLAYLRTSHKLNLEQESSRRALEKALDEAKVASEAKTVFLSSMSHDIRTPMNAIIGMTDIAAEHLDNRDKIKDCLDKISLSSRHLLTLINDVLDISKIESGKVTLTPIEFSLREMASALDSIIRPLMQSKNLSYTARLHHIDRDKVFADEVRINQIFINILSNAAKYTPDGGWVSMDLSQELLPDGRTVKLTYVVEDNGIGMSEAFMKTMYTSFARAKDSRINEIQGTGLGLAIVKQLVDLMDGTIDCQSKENHGTKFVITLHLPLATEDTQTPASSQQRDLTGLHLLIVEDNEINWEVLSELLAMRGITSDHAENGQVCIDMLTAAAPGTYDVVLMDIQMPVMNGREATKAIRASGQAHIRSLPIIAMTADAFAEDIAACLNIGMDGHASKPVNLDQLFQEIEKGLIAKENRET